MVGVKLKPLVSSQPQTQRSSLSLGATKFGDMRLSKPVLVSEGGDKISIDGNAPREFGRD
jgi:hypothetical protein